MSSSDITPKSPVSLGESGLMSFSVSSVGLGGSGGGSAVLGLKAREDNTQSPTQDETVALTQMSPFACWCRRRVLRSPGSGMKPPHASKIEGSVEIMAPSWVRLGTGRSCSNLQTKPAMSACSAVSYLEP